MAGFGAAVWRHGLRAAAIVAGGAALGLAANPLTRHPVNLHRPVFAASASGASVCSAGRPPAGPTTISQADARVACTGCTAAFVDARGASAYAEGHIPGAIHLPPSGHADDAAVLEKLRGYKTVVVYDDEVGCNLADSVADRLRAAGLPDVRVLQGSWSEWEASGAPAESGACDMCDPSTHTAGESHR